MTARIDRPSQVAWRRGMSEPVLEIPFDDAFQFDPSPTFGQLREHRPVARVRTLAGAEIWLVNRYDDVRLVLADPRFSRAAVVKQGAPRVALASSSGSGQSSGTACGWRRRISSRTL